MKSKLAFILGLACIILSAITLISALSHADGPLNTVTFTNTGGADICSTIRGVSVLENNPSVLKVGMDPVKFARRDLVTNLFIRFSGPYEAAAAKKILENKRVELKTTYLRSDSFSKVGAIQIRFVDGDGEVDRMRRAEGVLINSESALVYNNSEPSGASFETLAENQIRHDEVNKGAYLPTYSSQLRKYKDAFFRESKAFEYRLLHDDKPYGFLNTDTPYGR